MQTRVLLIRLAPLLMALLSACNSGGDGGATPPADTGDNDTSAPAPTLSAPSSLSVPEGSSKALDFSASVSGGAPLDLSLAGPDAELLRIQDNSVLFIDAPDFENPANEDNRYVFEIVASTGESSARTTVTVEITDVLEARIVDGPVADAIAFVDLNGDGVLDLDEPSTLSDANGYVTVPDFTPRDGVLPRLIATDGVDTFTGERLEGFSMTAHVPTQGTTTFMVTPLTSLLTSLGDASRGEALLDALGLTGDLQSIREQDPWQGALDGDPQARQQLALIQQLAFTLQALCDKGTNLGTGPLALAAFTDALQRRLAEQLIAGGLLTSPDALGNALNAALADRAALPLSEAQVTALTAAVADINALLAEADGDPSSDTTGAVLAVTQTTTPARLDALLQAQLTLDAFGDEQRQAFSTAVRSVVGTAPDTDGDGQLDTFDRDDDGDGIADGDDEFPLDPTQGGAPPAADLDGDGIADDQDLDDDGDGVNDTLDANPRDATVSAPAQFTEGQRFKLLAMSTFGPTPALMNEVQRLGPEGWVDAQLAAASAYDSANDAWPTHLERTIEIAEAFAPDVDFFTVDTRDGSVAFNERTAEPLVRRYQMAAWNDNVFGSVDHPLVGSDVLRQRTAYALSQLLVTSTSMPPLDQRGESLAYYYDLLAKHAFGNYRELLGDVARSPTMGTFLSHAANKKASAADATRPDENFARELVQLFTLGLYELQDDGTAVVDGNGNPVPVYTQDDVEELAKVMTGWNLAGSRAFRSPSTGDGDHTRPMVFDPEWHEDERDAYYGDGGDAVVTILGQAVALNAADRTLDGDGNSTNSGLDASLDVLFAHPNVAPYVAKHLIRHFVTANPSPAFVARIAQVFNDDGTDVKGNLGATVKAILLDQEAYSDDPSRLKIKEPLLAYTQLLRVLDVAPVPSGFLNSKGGTPITAVNILYESDLAEVLGYAPMRAESVFNFFDPEFVPADADLSSANLLAPEMAMLTDQYFANVANLVLWLSNTREFVRYDRGFSTRRVLGFSNVRVFDINFTAPLTAMELAMEGDSNMDFASINLEDGQGNQPYKIAAVEALVDWVDWNLFGGDLPAEYRDALTQHLRDGMHKGEGQNDSPEVKTEKRVLEAWELVRDALVMATAIPAYMVQ